MASENRVGDFKSSQLANLSSLSEEALGNLEEEISREFASVGKDYIRSRLPRINQMVQSLNNVIKGVTNNERYWMKIYNFEVDTISKITYNTEDVVLSADGGVEERKDVLRTWEEYEEEIRDLYRNLQSPLEFDTLLLEEGEQSLPFKQHFDAVIRPFLEKLQEILQERVYQENLIKENSSAHKNILWKQYYSNLIQHKNSLIDETYEKLNKLDKEYHNISRNEMNTKDWKHYYKSVIGPSALKRTSDEMEGGSTESYVQDFHYSSDNHYIKENRIELTDAKYRHLQRLKNHEYSQKQDDSKQGVNTKLASCQGLSSSEIDNDLMLLRSGIKKEKERDDVDLSPSPGSSYKKASIEKTHTRSPESPGEKESSNKYKFLLKSKSLFDNYSIEESQTASKVPHVLPELPSIERFPPLKTE